MHSAAAYRGLVERLEREQSQRPGWYRVRLAALALLGYAVLALALVLALAFSVGLLALLVLTKSVLLLKLIKLVWIPLLLAWLILRALWVRIPEPPGRRLAPGEAPALEREVERLRQAAGAPPLAGIIIDADLNAAAASVPRLLGLAGHRHYLVLGLPLLRLLDPAQMASVIAHEFGHFGAGHGRFSGWIYRLRESWFRLLEALQHKASAAGGVFARFFGWYAPYFNAYSFVLARGNEYEADAAAARLVGVAPAAQALVRVNLAARRLHGEFWPGIGRLNLAQPEPPVSVYAAMVEAIGRPAPDDAQALGELLARRPGLDDTHPVLAQRLQALAAPAEVPALPATSAAEAWLGPLAAQWQAEFDRDWREWVAADWGERFESVARDRERLAELDRRRAAGELAGDEAVQHAVLVEDLRPEEDALPLYRSALAALPDHALGQFRLGSLLLARGEAEGVRHIEQAMALDGDATEAGLQRLGDFHHGRGDEAALDSVRERLQQWHRRRAAADAERQRLHKRDPFLPHGLDAGAVAALCAVLERHGKVGRAWLVRKHIDGGGPPHFVLLVKWRGLVLSEQGQLESLIEPIELPGTLFAIAAGADAGAEKQIRRVAGEPLHGRGWF